MMFTNSSAVSTQPLAILIHRT